MMLINNQEYLLYDKNMSKHQEKISKKGKSIIYMVQCKSSKDQIYIGKTHQESLEDRIDQHKEAAKKGSTTKFHNALLDYGLVNWEWIILATCPIEEEIEREKKLIKKFNALPINSLNTVHAKKNKSKDHQIRKELEPNLKGNKFYKIKKSKLGTHFQRVSGKLKPVKNLKTGKVYKSTMESTRKENLPLSTIRLCCNKGKMLKDGTRFAYLNIDDEPILTEGHGKQVYVGDKKKKYTGILNLINEQVFDNVKSAARHFSVSHSTIDGVARGKYLTLKQKWVLCYLDSNGTPIITARHKKGLEKIENMDKVKFMAWHIDDVDRKSPYYFKTLKQIAEKLNLNNPSHITSVCRGNRAHTEKWRIAYFDADRGEPTLTKKHSEAPKKVIRKVICLNDNETFNNSADAGRFYGLNPSAINNCARGNAKSVYKNSKRLRFAFLDDNDEPMLKDKHEENLEWRGKKKILWLEEGKTFNSLASFCRETGLPQKTAKRYLKDEENVELNEYRFIEIDW